MTTATTATTATSTAYTVDACLKMVGVEQLSASKVVDSESYEGLSEYFHITSKDIAYPGSTSETSWAMLRLEFPSVAANGKWEVQIGIAYIRQAKKQKFVAIKPMGDQNDRLAFKNLNTLPVDLQFLFEMGFLASDDKAVSAVNEWLTSGQTTLRLAAVNMESYLDFNLAVRVAGKNAAAYGTVTGALAKNPLGMNSYWGEGFTPVTTKVRNVLVTRKPMTGKTVVLAPTVVTYPQDQDQAEFSPVPVVEKTVAQKIEEFLKGGLSLEDALKELNISAPSTVSAKDEDEDEDCF